MYVNHCLFLTNDDPITPKAPTGGPPLVYSRLELLAHSDCAITLVILAEQDSNTFVKYTQQQPQVWERVRGWCECFYTITLPSTRRESAPLQNFFLGLVDPSSYCYPQLQQEIITALRELIDKHRPQVIWSQRELPTTLAMKTAPERPILHGHYDWPWRIKPLRFPSKRGSYRYRFRWWVRRRHGLALLQRVTACVSASYSEAVEISALGGDATYIPITYSPVERSEDSIPEPPTRIVHLGGMKTTASRVGLERFLDVVWPDVRRRVKTRPELWVVGSLSGAPESLLKTLSDVGAICTGFVEDLSTVLRPFDIHIIPWEHNTGTRARIPLALNHGQAIIATRAASACVPELVDGENCLLVTDLHSMVESILALLNDEDRRFLLGQAARSTFADNFTRAGIQHRFNEYLNSLY